MTLKLRKLQRRFLGDYNRNGVADAADYTLWRNTLGQSVPPVIGNFRADIVLSLIICTNFLAVC
jgi:hypothetical protein